MKMICMYCKGFIELSKKDLNTRVECSNCKKAFVLDMEYSEKAFVGLFPEYCDELMNFLKSDSEKLADFFDSNEGKM